MDATETELRLIVTCAWCGRRIKRGKPGSSRLHGTQLVPAVSHGICRNCYIVERTAIGKAASPGRHSSV